MEEQFSMFAFSPLFTPPATSGFVAFDEDFSFPVNHHHDRESDLPNSINYSWDVNPAVLIPQPPPPPPPVSGGGLVVAEEMKKKKNHNESEKMRRMRLNGLFAALRSVLPGSDHMKKIGAPSTVERVIKYIPELRHEVEALIKRRQQLLPTTSTTKNDVVFSQAPAAWACTTAAASSSGGTMSFAAWSVQVTDLSNGEISIQISTPKSLINTFIPISEVLRMLEEEDGLLVIGISSSDSSAGRVFYHIHLITEQETNKIDCELVRKKILNSCLKWEEMCLWMITQGM